MHLLALGLLAIASAYPRFGQRENEGSELSDSDYYLDMVVVFSGEAPEFDPVYSAPGHPGSKHYARPLLSLLATQLRAVTGMEARAAFSAIAVAGAWAIAAGLYLLLATARPEMHLVWLPSALFLTGFPQVNWGYHILSDTLGYATAFLAALFAWGVLRWHRAAEPRLWSLGVIGALLGLFALQTAAFLTRETGWFTPVIVVGLVAMGRRWRSDLPIAAAMMLALLLAKLPHVWYVGAHGLEPLQIPFAPALWFDPLYALDFLVKSFVAFHVAWVLFFLGLKRFGLAPVPDLALAWGLAGLLYITAGYTHNSLEGIGYPLRLTYALFPVVYILSAQALASRFVRPARRLSAAVLLVLANAAAAFTGVALDPGRSVAVAPLASGVVRSGPPGELESRECVGAVGTFDVLEAKDPLDGELCIGVKVTEGPKRLPPSGEPPAVLVRAELVPDDVVLEGLVQNDVEIGAPVLDRTREAP